ncbi:MAG: LacI family DNA-binding transcriptional regulator [Opitutaceae bacterium]|nr:LacI family DNA-binding transcriptional regulator [Opitutaceae bacterium]
MPVPRPSLRDIARKLNVSHVTVSMALRNHPRISAARCEEVQRVSREMGYRPDPMLSSLIAYRQSKQVKPIAATLAWINRWPDPRALRRQGEFNAYWEGATEAADRLGYRVEEFVVTPDLTAARLNKILQARSVFGLLIPPHPAPIQWSSFAIDWPKFAIVRFGFSALDLKAHMIGNDQMRSGELAVRRAHDLGYRRMGYLTCSGFDSTTDGNFRVGFQRGLETVAVRCHPKPLVLEGRLEQRLPKDLAAMRAWLHRWKPDAILTSEPALPEVLRQFGLRVPDSLGLFATTVRDCGTIDAGLDQNPMEIGRVAAKTLIELVNQQELGNPLLCRRVLVEGSWVNGKSLPPRVT